jgi:hypothetical protein
MIRFLKYIFLQLIVSTTVLAQLVPPDVEQRIKQVYIQKYPDDYSMQKTLIEDQINSYQYLQSWASESKVPQDVFDKIKADYVQKYPDDYSMQKTLIQDQVQSYIQLHK